MKTRKFKGNYAKVPVIKTFFLGNSFVKIWKEREGLEGGPAASMECLGGTYHARKRPESGVLL
jgi:hypothetical protein